MAGKAKKQGTAKAQASKPRKSATKARKPATKSKSPPKPAANAGGSVGRSAGDWREQTLARVRALIQGADPDVVEEVKWRKPSNAMQGVATWSHDGLICTGETYKDKVKFTFARGAALEDPAGLFNADDRGATRRAIDLRDGEMVDASAFKELVRAAVSENGAGNDR